jgi:hypothetical protein
MDYVNEELNITRIGRHDGKLSPHSTPLVVQEQLRTNTGWVGRFA